MTAQCGACGAPTGDSAHLCAGCTQRLRGALADLPPLLDELDTARTRQTSMPASAIGDDTCQHHGDCGCGVSLPWNDKASRVAAGIRNALTTWCRIALEEGLATTGPELAREAKWLTWCIGIIRHQPWAPDMLADLTRRRTDALTTIDTPEDRLYAGPCNHTPADAEQPCGRRLWARLDQAAITCRGCGTIHVVADRQAWMLEAAADILMPAPELASTLTLILRVRVPNATLRSWIHRGKLTPRGDRAGANLYRFGDAHNLWRAGDRDTDETRTA